MRTDVYTKIVLTVIAAALVAHVIQNSVDSATAQVAGVQKVQICDEHSCLRLNPVRNVASTGQKFLTFALPVMTEAP